MPPPRFRAIIPWIALCLAVYAPVRADDLKLGLAADQSHLVVQAPAGAPIAIYQSDDLSGWTELTNGIATGGRFELALEPQRQRFFCAGPAESIVTLHPGSFVVGVNPKLVPMADGHVWGAAAAEVTVRPGTNYIAGDLFDRRLHVLNRSLHQGAVYYARVIADDSGAVSADILEAGFPQTLLPKTTAAIAAHRPLKILLLGDTLLDDSGTPDVHATWPYLLFQPSASTNGWTMLKDVGSLSVTRLGYPILRSEYGLIATNPDSALLQAGYDVAILSFQVNGTDVGRIGCEAVYLEAAARALRQAGTEVILTTGQQRANDPMSNPPISNEALMHDLAQAQGCAIADSTAYMTESDGTYLKDQIYPSVLGHQRWAGALRSLLNGLPKETAAFVPTGGLASLAYLDDADETEQFRCPDSAKVQFQPTSSNGVPGAATFPDSLGPVVGGLPASSAVTVLTAGQTANFHADLARTVSLLTENREGETALVRVYFEGLNWLTDDTVSGGAGPRIFIEAAVGQLPWDQPVNIKIMVLQGTLRLAGVSFLQRLD